MLIFYIGEFIPYIDIVNNLYRKLLTHTHSFTHKKRNCITDYCSFSTLKKVYEVDYLKSDITNQIFKQFIFVI